MDIRWRFLIQPIVILRLMLMQNLIQNLPLMVSLWLVRVRVHVILVARIYFCVQQKAAVRRRQITLIRLIVLVNRDRRLHLLVLLLLKIRREQLRLHLKLVKALLPVDQVVLATFIDIWRLRCQFHIQGHHRRNLDRVVSILKLRLDLQALLFLHVHELLDVLEYLLARTLLAISELIQALLRRILVHQADRLYLALDVW